MSVTLETISPFPDSGTKEYLLEEQIQRRRELDSVITRIESDQRNGLFLTGAAWSWLLTNGDKITDQLNVIAAALPALVVAFFFYRNRGLTRFISLVAEYTCMLEKHFQMPEHLGWETHVARLRQTGNYPSSLGKRARVFWLLLLLLNVTIGIAYYLR